MNLFKILLHLLTHKMNFTFTIPSEIINNISTLNKSIDDLDITGSFLLRISSCGIELQWIHKTETYGYHGFPIKCATSGADMVLYLDELKIFSFFNFNELDHAALYCNINIDKYGKELKSQLFLKNGTMIETVEVINTKRQKEMIPLFMSIIQADLKTPTCSIQMNVNTVLSILQVLQDETEEKKKNILLTIENNVCSFQVATRHNKILLHSTSSSSPDLEGVTSVKFNLIKLTRVLQLIKSLSSSLEIYFSIAPESPLFFSDTREPSYSKWVYILGPYIDREPTVP
jgi:hypothetical protein